MASGVAADGDVGERRALGFLGRGATRAVAALLKGVEKNREVKPRGETERLLASGRAGSSAEG